MQCNQIGSPQQIKTNADKVADAAQHSVAADATIAANPATTKTKIKTIVLIARLLNAVLLIQKFQTRNVIGTQNTSVIISVGSAMKWKSRSNLTTSFWPTWEDIQMIVTTIEGVRICELMRDGR